MTGNVDERKHANERNMLNRMYLHLINIDNLNIDEMFNLDGAYLLDKLNFDKSRLICLHFFSLIFSIIYTVMIEKNLAGYAVKYFCRNSI